MLDRVPDVYREVLILHQLQDLSFAEVACQMGRNQAEAIIRLPGWKRICR